MNKIFQTIGIVALLTITSIMPLQAANDYDNRNEETTMYLEMVEGIFDAIRRNYVEEVDDKALLEAAIVGMVKTLDPHSTYFTKEEFESFRNNMSGNFYGIGIEISLDEETGYLKVISPIEGSPAFRAGFKPGDLISTVGGVKIKGMTLKEIVEMVRGPKGTAVLLGVVRGDKAFIVSVIRDAIKQTAATGKMINDNIAYIRLVSFSQSSMSDVRTAINDLKAELKDENFKAIILDLRYNPGGLLDQAIAITDLFINEGLIVLTKGRGGVLRSQFSANNSMIVPITVPIFVLINKESASASEVVAGALQDLERAVIVGEKSYGKGSVQGTLRLPNGGGLKLTIAKYYTASGKTIHGVGITPDVVVVLDIEFDFTSLEKDENDPQLQKVIDLINE